MQKFYSKYGRIFDLLPELILILDDGKKIVDHNAAASVKLGLSAEELHGREIDSIVAESGRKAIASLLQSSDQGRHLESQFVTATGEAIDVDLDIKVLEGTDRQYQVLIAKDITGQKKRDLDYLRFSNVIEHTINPIQITDANGLMVYVNPAFEHASGFSKEELIGKNPRILSSGRHSRDFWGKVWRYILGGKVWVGQVENRRKDGSPLHTELLISPIVGDQGKVIGFLGAHRDITEQKMLEQQLVRSQKMESIGTLAAGIAHEVGNPLTSISSLVQVIQRTTNDEPAKEKLELIKNQINRIARIIRDLVDFSRPSTNVERPTDVNRVVRDALNIVQYGKKVKGISFEVELNESLPPLMLVADQLTQVFINILINAVDSFEGKSGTIQVVSGLNDGSVEIRVIDSGKGISKDDRDKIFEPFFTTKEVGEGTGLGLWVSYGIVRNFRGDILVESNPGKGSTFTVVFPVKG
ncbi:MAG: PAS domain S-box protein [Ignavibacteriales bacterium]|nr:PAS domain S-box protein [Ignavibacteriales bacterium]